MRFYTEALERLKSLSNGKVPPPETSGLCGFLEPYMEHYTDEEIDDIHDTMRAIFERWVKFSGDCSYPVPHPEYRPSNGYHYNADRLFDRSTEYGRNRWELVDYMVEELSALTCQ